jgi:tRNA A37 threonylcarbamoyladenosine modification protein TsaB
MILYLDSIKNEALEIEVKLVQNDQEVFCQTVKAKGRQAEKLIPAIVAVLQSSKINLKSIKKIIIENSGGSFTALRIGVTTANALAYALGIEVEGTVDGKKNKLGLTIIEPLYNREPNITIGAKKI